MTALVFVALTTRASDVSGSQSGFITPQELVVQLTDDSDPNDGGTFASFDRRWSIVSATRIVEPKSTANGLRRRLERTWTIRYRRDAPVETAVAECSALPNVVWAEPNRLYKTLDNRDLVTDTVPDDPKYGEQWGLPAIQMPKAWSIERGDPSVVVATVDTGASLTHPDLSGQLWTNPGEIADNGVDDDGNGFVDDVYGWDFVDAPNAGGKGDYAKRDNDPTDETGHGTHVAGIVAARPDNEIGIAGVAWNCRLMVVRAGYAARDGGTFLQEDDSAAAIVYAAENGASVVNLSWGDEQGSFLLRDVVRYTYELDVVLVGATGNDSRSTIVFPAAYPEVISVAASDQNDDAAYFTNGHAGVDVAAPGIVVLSLDINGGMRTLSGTSMAAPHVTGIVGLMRAKRRMLRVETVRAILKTTADPLHDAGRLVGVGRVNAYRSVVASTTTIARLGAITPKLAADASLSVEGVVTGVDVVGYRLLYGESETPTNWIPLAEVRDRRRNGVLYTWRTAGVAEGVYALRLEAFDNAGTMTRDQVLVVVDHSAPRALRHEVLRALRDGRLVSVLWFETDDEASVVLSAERLDTGDESVTIRFATARRRVVPIADIARFGRWRYRIVATNAVGMTVSVDGEFDAEESEPNPAAMTPFGDRRPPSMDVARSSTDFDGDGEREIVGGTPGATGFRVTQVYEFAPDGRYRAAFAFREPISPLDVGDSDGDGKVEVLGLSGNHLVVVEPAIVGGYPSREIARFAGIRYARFADVNGDGRADIVARRDASKVVVFVADSDNRFRELAVIENPTSGRNMLADAVAVDDVDGDGSVEIVVADAEGEVIVSRYEGDAFTTVGVFPSRFRNAKALASGSFEGRAGVVLVADDVYDPTIPRAALLTVSLLIWNISRRTIEEVAALPILADDDAPSVVVARTMPSASDSIALLAANGFYVLKRTTGGLALAWSSPASPTRFAATDISGDGLAEVLFSNQGTLNTVSDVTSPDLATRPFAVSVKALAADRVRITWRTEAPTDAEIYRSVNGGAMSKIATVSNATEYVDRTVRVNTRYLYEVAVGESRSPLVGVFVGEQPKLLVAKALSPRRVSVAYSLPMGAEAREPRRYALHDAAGRARQPSSVVAYRNESREHVLSFDEDLANGDWTITVVSPAEVTSREAMPLDERYVSTTFTAHFEIEIPITLGGLRVYPNPVYPARNHAAAVVFDGVPVGAEIRVFDGAGSIVAEERADANGRWTWNLLNDASRPVGSGIYLYEVLSGSERRIGKLAVVR